MPNKLVKSMEKTKDALAAEQAEAAKLAEEKKVTEAKTKEEADAKVQADAEAAAKVKKEETAGDILETGQKKSKDKVEPKTVPEAVFLELKKELKTIKKSLEDNKSNDSDVSEDLQALAAKHNLDPNFLEELGLVMQNKSQVDFDKAIAEKMKPIEEKEKVKEIDKRFDMAFKKTISSYPEFEKVVNKEVIKTLALNPENAQKTFIQLMEGAYGHLVTGKRTIEPSGGHNRDAGTTVDVVKAKTDSKYFKEVMADPVLKKQYNDQLASSLSSHL